MTNRYAYFPSLTTAGELTPTEEQAVSWLWSSPRLLAWRLNITWLWSRVDTKRAAASLHGIDSAGSLMRVEINIERGAPPDPFARLVLEMKSATNRRDSTAEVLYEKWRKCRARNSCGRAAKRWFQCRYNADITPADHAYERSVERLLDLRQSLGNPHPVLVGVVGSTRTGFRVAPEARRNFEQLQKRVGDERVLLRVLRGTLDAKGGLRVQCQTSEGGESRFLVARSFR